MADGKKNEDNKIIKNPLLSQSLLLEELSGVSFIVPAPPRKSSLETDIRVTVRVQGLSGIVLFSYEVDPLLCQIYLSVSRSLLVINFDFWIFCFDGSNTGVDVPPFGEKKQGSTKDFPQSTQSFTDIPLNRPDLSTIPNDKPDKKTEISLLPSSKEEQSKSSLSSFLSLLVPPPLSNPVNLPAVVDEEPVSSIVKVTEQGVKRQPTPQLYEPELVPVPPPSDPKPNVLIPRLPAENKSVNLSDSTASVTDLTRLTKTTELPHLSEPPRGPLPPPPLSTQTNVVSKNPYALRNIHNAISTPPHLSKSPIGLGSSDSVPLYPSTPIPKTSPNVSNFFSGPQIACSSGIQSNTNLNSSQQTGSFLVPDNNSQPAKELTDTHNISHEQIPPVSSDLAFDPNKVAFNISNTYQELKLSHDVNKEIHGLIPHTDVNNISYEQKPQNNVDLAFETNKITFNPLNTIYSDAQNISLEQNHTVNLDLNKVSFNAPNTFEELQSSSCDIKLVHDPSTSSPYFANSLVQSSHIVQKGSLNKIVSSVQNLFTNSNQPTNIPENLSLSKPPVNIENINIQPPLPTSNSSLSSIASSVQSIFSNSNQPTNIPENISLSEQSMSNENVISEPPLPASVPSLMPVVPNAFSDTVTQSVPLIPVRNANLPDPLLQHQDHSSKNFENGQFSDRGTSASMEFQSKQVTANNIPINENQLVDNNNIPISQGSENITLTSVPSLSQFFSGPQVDIKSIPSNILLPIAPNLPVATSICHSASDILPPSIYFHPTQATSPGSYKKPIHNTITSFSSHESHQHQISTSINSQIQPDPSITIPTAEKTSNPCDKPQDPNQTNSIKDTILLKNTSPSTTISNSPPSILSPSNSSISYHQVSSDQPPPVFSASPKSDSSVNPFSRPKAKPSVHAVPPKEKTNPSPNNPLIPTFNYFSSPQASCLPPPLDQPIQNVTTSDNPPPSSYYFKPIQTPDSGDGQYLPPSTVLNNSAPAHQVHNPIPSAPPKTFNFPPPNVYYSKENPSSSEHQTPYTEVTQQIPNSENRNFSDGEELDQIPLEGSAVPLFNPETINKKKKVLNSVGGNTFRLSGGIKKPAYAPVPDLGVTERRSLPATSPSGFSASSQEEMAAIHGSQNQNSKMGSPSKTPESPLAVANYLENDLGMTYRPPYNHWFFKSGRNKKSPWTPFSMADSLNLEQVFTSADLQEDTKVTTDGGRYDVEILRRKKVSVYWDETPGEVRRCSWFVKSVSDSRYIPYDENIANLLEDEYKQGCETNEWNRKVELADGEVIILHGPSAIAHHVRSGSPDAWSTQPPLQQKSRVVKRGVEDFDIPKGEPKQVDHLLLVVHGIGKACDLRFRSLVDVVDDFRSISLQLVQSHFHSGVENGMVGRVEVLPVEWHKALHTETIDDRLSAITLPSIPRAREFTNETLLDILFYTSPVFCEKIVQAVGAELNRVFSLYQKRNPGFRGQVSLGAHSLGSLILFDMLCHQHPVHKPHVTPSRTANSEDDEDIDAIANTFMRKAKLNRRMSYLTIGPGAGQPYTIYPQLLFQPKAFFALGSPIGMFVTVRGVEALGEDFKFPTCPAFFNIFHPNDPVAYRIEALIKPDMAKVPAVLIPHHKGRKRMHLELKETMAHITAALKQKLVDSMKNTWNAVYQLAMFNRKDNNLHGEVNKVIEDEVLREAAYLESDPPIGIVGEEATAFEYKVGKLNDGRRIDYVLQEAPLETFNQYISAIRSHLVYWESEDTMLLILKEIYGQMGITPDSQVPQPILPFDISGENDTYSEYTYSIGAPPTQFVRK